MEISGNVQLTDERIEEIRGALRRVSEAPGLIRYVAPWTDVSLLEEGSIDMLFSNAVYEHIDDIDFVNRAVFRWLAPGAVAIHRVDFGCHGTAKSWNGHWTIPKSLWRIIRGNRPYTISRHTPDTHLDSFTRAGFRLLAQYRQELSSPVTKEMLAQEFAEISATGLQTRQAFYVLQKPA